MATNPISVRFSDVATKIIQAASKTNKKTPSDFIREAVEEKVFGRNGYGSQLGSMLMEPQETLGLIRNKLNREARGEFCEPLSRLDLSALMMFWHNAYQLTSGFANPTYVMCLLDLTKDLLLEARAQNVDTQLDDLHSKLGIEPEEGDYDSEFAVLKDEFRNNGGDIGWAESLASPVAILAAHLDQFSSKSISKIFTDSRIRILLPLAVKGARAGKSENLIDEDMNELLPDWKNIKVGSINFAITSDRLRMVAQGNHHTYMFKVESFLSLIVLAESQKNMGEESWRVFRRSTFEVVLNRGTAHINESGGYRLQLSTQEFVELIEQVREMIKDRRWSWLIQRFRNLMGDI